MKLWQNNHYKPMQHTPSPAYMNSPATPTAPPPPPPPLHPGPPDLVKVDGVICKRVQVGEFITAHQPVNIPDLGKQPSIQYGGPRIPIDTWKTVLSFFEWSQRTHHSEATLRLFVNETTGEWKPWAFPQEITGGMAAKELHERKDYSEQNEAIGKEFRLYGSVHHHCTGSAFQSGTDTRDEIGWNGVHITVGNITKAAYDLHGRVVLMGLQSEISWDQWFQIPEEVARYFSASRHGELLKIILTTPPLANHPFPEQWKANMIEAPKYTVKYHGYSGGVGMGSGHNQYPIGGPRTSVPQAKAFEIFKEIQGLSDQLKTSVSTLVMGMIGANFDDLPIQWARYGPRPSPHEFASDEETATAVQLVNKFGKDNNLPPLELITELIRMRYNSLPVIWCEETEHTRRDD